MSRLLLFNNSNDLALASGAREYIPPKSVARMEHDLAALPFWWADDGDAVLLNNMTQVYEAEKFFSRYTLYIYFTCDEEGYNALCKRAGKSFTPQPWGWSKAAHARFQRFGVPKTELPDDAALDGIRELSSKEFAVHYIKELFKKMQNSTNMQLLIGNKMRFVRDLDGFAFSERTIFKSPWSSSGRGIFFADSLDAPSIRDKLTGFIKRQGGFVADRMYNKTLDFALEYQIEENGEAQFLGYSLFTAGGNGFYGYNTVVSQDELRRKIVDGGCDAALLKELIQHNASLLKEMLGGKYRGIVGIDMLIAEEENKLKIHPCVEVNLRMNIGVLAICVFNRCGNSDTLLTPPATGGFNACCNNGKLLISR